MRLDLFLKVARLVKRRTVAQEMISVGAVRLDGRSVKPSAEVRVGSRLEIAYPRRVLVVDVEIADEKALRRGAEGYRVVEERRVSGDVSPWTETGERRDRGHGTEGDL